MSSPKIVTGESLESMRRGVDLDREDGTLTYPGPDGYLGIWRDGKDYVFERAYGGLAPIERSLTLAEAEEKLWLCFWAPTLDADLGPDPLGDFHGRNE